MRRHRVTGHGGVGLSVFDVGPQTAPAILLLHGWSQHHLSWARQTPLSDRFRLVMPDLRGHGATDNPDDASCYDTSEPWATDVATIIETLNLNHPVLVGWSMGGAVACDYIRLFGDQALSGFALVGSFATTGSYLLPEVSETRAGNKAAVAAGMVSDNQSDNLADTLAFLKICFHQQPDPDDLAKMMGFNMLCPPYVRAASRQRDEDYRPDLARMTKPALVLSGARDVLSLPPCSEEAVQAIPTARALIYENCGHSPFWEEPERFNSDLAEFARTCFDMEPGR